MPGTRAAAPTIRKGSATSGSSPVITVFRPMSACLLKTPTTSPHPYPGGHLPSVRQLRRVPVTPLVDTPLEAGAQPLLSLRPDLRHKLSPGAPNSSSSTWATSRKIVRFDPATGGLRPRPVTGANALGRPFQAPRYRVNQSRAWPLKTSKLFT
jgi:hypothetical protein